jgi:hypothetical protein
MSRLQQSYHNHEKKRKEKKRRRGGRSPKGVKNQGGKKQPLMANDEGRDKGKKSGFARARTGDLLGAESYDC